MVEIKRKPRCTVRVRRGLEKWYPVMSSVLDAPSDSELQELSSKEIEDVTLAWQWIGELLNYYDK